ncbi:MAG TPA: SIR2 family protein [Pyrinomonadaceae bacterium]|jgi:hypothetical protein
MTPEILAVIKEKEEHALDEIAASVSSGKCNLFLGAGVHASPPENSPYKYEESKRPPIGSALSRALAAKSQFSKRFPDEDIRNLQRVAQDFEVQFKRPKLIEEIKKAVDVGKEPSEALCALAKMNFPVIVTTNYDHLLEKAFQRADKEPSMVSIYKKNEDRKNKEETDDLWQDDPTPDKPFLFKVHGDINRPESIVITDEDYIHFILRMTETGGYNPVPETVRVRMKKWPTLFIGYSLRDYNLRVLFKTLRWGIDKANYPNTYSVDLYPDRLIYEMWSQAQSFVWFLAQDVWTFVPELYRRVRGEEMVQE